jgi:carbon-monoxide dehydrogenase catalytic subunit
VEASRDLALLEKAKQVGAKGIRLYGICCSGLSSLYRYGDVHPLSNAVGAELVMGTGALDVWVADLQDVYPSIMEVAACFHTKVVTTNDSCKLPGAVHIGIDHRHENLNEIADMARRIVELAINNYPLRQSNNVFIPDTAIDAEIGFAVENITQTFGGIEHLLAPLQNGDIKGIVNLVGCNNPKVMYEKAIVDITEYLLANDILILTNGCASFPLLKLGYCNQSALEKAGPGLRKVLQEKGLPPVWHMGECTDNARASGLFRALADKAVHPIKNMPFVFAGPEWSNEKGVGAALSFRLMGINSYHCVPAPVSGSDRVQDFFTNRTKELLGSVMTVIPEPLKLAEKIVKDIEDRRSRLGWQ